MNGENRPAPRMHTEFVRRLPELRNAPGSPHAAHEDEHLEAVLRAALGENAPMLQTTTANARTPFSGCQSGCPSVSVSFSVKRTKVTATSGKNT